jgi:ferredoxin
MAAMNVTPQATSSANAAEVTPNMPGKYLVKVLRDTCIGAGPCSAVAPTVFQLDQENKAVVLSQDELDELKLLAAQSCPVAAIIVTNVETGEQVWPIK